MDVKTKYVLLEISSSSDLKNNAEMLVVTVKHIVRKKDVFVCFFLINKWDY